MDYGPQRATVLAAVKAELDNDPAGIGYKVNQTLQDHKTLTRLLTQPTNKPNPTPQPQVPAALTVANLMSLLSASSQANIVHSGYAKVVADAIVAQDRDGLLLWMQLLLTSNVITSDEATALQNALNVTIPDPQWSATVLGPSRLETIAGYGAIDTKDVADALAS
jgi:hypothetical protein